MAHHMLSTLAVSCNIGQYKIVLNKKARGARRREQKGNMSINISRISIRSISSSINIIIHGRSRIGAAPQVSADAALAPPRLLLLLLLLLLRLLKGHSRRGIEGGIEDKGEDTEKKKTASCLLFERTIQAMSPCVNPCSYMPTHQGTGLNHDLITKEKL